MIPKQVARDLDALCKAVIWCRDHGKCVRAGCDADQFTSVLDWAHVHTRGWKSIRWDTDNSMLLCKRCHMIWHGQIIVAGIDSGRHAWWSGQYPERERRLNLLLQTQRADRRRRSIDTKLIEVSLMQDFKLLTGHDWTGV